MKLFLIGLLALLSGCGEKAAEKPREKAPEPPKIKHFYGNQAVVPKGESLTLCYGTENVETLTLSPSADGNLRPSFNRCVSESPTQDTTYTLTAKGPGGETSATFAVKVGAAAPRSQAQKELIQNFQIVGNTPVAPGARVQLCYTAEGAATVSVRPAVEAKLASGKNQCFLVTPSKTTTYVLTATGADGAADRMQVTVAVQ